MAVLFFPILGVFIWFITGSLWWAVGVALLGFVFVMLLWLMWERARINPDRITEATQHTHEAELDHTFTDQVAYFFIFGRQWGPYPIVEVNAGNMQGPCFVRCMGLGADGLDSYLAFRFTDYRIR